MYDTHENSIEAQELREGITKESSSYIRDGKLSLGQPTPTWNHLHNHRIHILLKSKQMSDFMFLKTYACTLVNWIIYNHPNILHFFQQNWCNEISCNESKKISA